MVTLSNEIIKKNFFIEENKIDEKSIDWINDYSELLIINNITTSDLVTNDDKDFLHFIKCYENLLHTNDFSMFKCPICKNHNFRFHKLYTRNIVFNINKYLIEGTIGIIVIECQNCKEKHNIDNDIQHYHAILPDAIFPYHAFSSSIILNALSDKIKKIKNEIILNRYQISRQLLNKWLKIFEQYLVSSSTILKIMIDKQLIIQGIINTKNRFQYQFFEIYFHPYFLNKRTCVTLAITP